MDWISIITALLPSLSITGVLFWKLDRSIKAADAKKATEEATQSGVMTQSQKLDLGDKYMELVNKLSDMMIENTELTKNGNGKMDQVVERLDRLEQEVAANKEITNKLVRFENGRFQQFLLDESNGKEVPSCAHG